MSEDGDTKVPAHDVPAPTELIYLPRPSWSPFFVAMGLTLMVTGIYGQGFLVRGYIYSIIGAIFFLSGLRSLVGTSVRDFFNLPRRQRVRSAVLPAASLKQIKRG